MEQVQALVEQYFDCSNGVLHIQGLSVTEIAERYGTPLFLYNAEAIEAQLSRLQRALPQQFEICYSVKANPHAVMMKFFLAHDCGLEIASIGEYQRTIKAGCPPEKILFAGPGKTEAELAAVIAQGIGEIHAESLTELQRLDRISAELGKPTKVAIRVNPSSEAQGGAMQMGGKPAPFGMDEENLEQALDFIAAASHLTFHGLHLFVGTQVLSHDILLAQYRKGLEIARYAAKYLDMPLSTLDFGGGLGIPYFSNEQALDLERLSVGLQALMTEIEGDPYLANTRFIVEPGRFLVGPSGLYVARVNDIKVSRGKTFAILDGGMHHHLAASGNLGQVIKRNYPLAVLNNLATPDSGTEETVDVVGPLCTPLDTLGRKVTLPKLNIGDLVGIFQSGAYGRTASPMGFLSHPVPPEIWVERGQAILVSERVPYAH